jgi:tetratricopeptide (TPR) repeat protein
MKTPVRPKGGKAGGAPAGGSTAHPPDQLTVFGEAARLFHRGEFVEARLRFQNAASGPNREVAHTARLHIRMCEQRIAASMPDLRTAEDRYNYAIALINQRKLAAADEQLKKAVAEQPGADHYHYALALSRGLQGDLRAAADHLRQAIDINPRNRAAARTDPDFQELWRHELFREAIGERKGPAA